MKRLINTLFAVAAFAACAVPLVSLANHETVPVLADKVPIMQTICKADGMQGQGDPSDKVCYIFVEDPSNGGMGVKYWVAVTDNQENVVAVFERTVGDENIKAVWKKGNRSV